MAGAGRGKYEPSSHVWYGGAAVPRRVVPPLRTLLAVRLLFWLAVGVAGYWLLSRTAGKRQILGGALVLGYGPWPSAGL